MLDPISPSMCAAKWLNATIWLNSGTTASCHHPPPHPIDLKEIRRNPSAIHNTAVKKQARGEMQRGIRPKECEYCWKIEDLGPENISDRVFKTVIYDDEDVRSLARLEPAANVPLQTLEVAFDRTCQFACMYCSPSFSTTWAQDIQRNGAYEKLPTDKRRHYLTTHEWASSKPDNPYTEAFWKWWPELRKTLKQFRITGGEPLMSANFWRLLEDYPTDPRESPRLAVNTNLGAPDAVIDRLIERARRIPHLEIYSSGEAFGAAAEYIRDGLEWSQWARNMERLMESGVVKRMHVMMTINGLCLFSMTEFLDRLLEWKGRFTFENPTLSVNILRFPTFQSPLVLPPELRARCRDELRDWFEKNKDSRLLINFEKDSLRRLIEYLSVAETATEDAEPRDALEKDLKNFLLQYDRRRGKNFRSALRADAVDWIASI